MSTLQNPALFVSSLSPGFIAGGSQCTFAFLRAVSEIHRGRVTYLGPPFLEPKPAVVIESSLLVRPRPFIAKAFGLLTGRHVDRTTPAAVTYLKKHKTFGVVYVNGEISGKVVGVARRLGMPVVFIPHNFAPEYLTATARHPRIDIRWLHRRVAIRCALEGYRLADLRLCLTEHDRLAYERATGTSGAAEGNMYFGYPMPPQPLAATPETFTVLVNTNMASRENEDGVIFFLNHVWTHINGREGWRLILAGRHPTARIKDRAAQFGNVEVISRPEPEQMEALFARSSVCVASSRTGSGIKLRVAEALRRGLPVVSSAHCSRGYEQVSPDVMRIYGSPEECLLQLRSLAQEDLDVLRLRCRAEYERHFSFSVGVSKCQAALGTLRLERMVTA